MADQGDDSRDAELALMQNIFGSEGGGTIPLRFTTQLVLWLGEIRVAGCVANIQLFENYHDL